MAVRFTEKTAELGILLDPELKLGESYMDGSLLVERGSIADLLSTLMQQDRLGGRPRWARPQWLLRYLKRRLQQFNPRPRARRNAAHHYDLHERLYALFLTPTANTARAYFETPTSRSTTPSSPRNAISRPSCSPPATNAARYRLRLGWAGALSR